MTDWPRLIVCPDRPHLLARCRSHKIHFLDGIGGGNAYPKLTFTIDIYYVTGQPSWNCRRISTDSHTIYGQRLYDWDCSFVDSDRLAIAYRDAYFGPKTLCLLLYDISRRRFCTCNINDDDDEEDENDENFRFDHRGPMASRATAEETMADYMLKRDRLFIVSPSNNFADFRLLTSYRLSWPLETSLTLTPLWEPKREFRIRVRPPADFRRRRFYTRSSFLSNDDILRVFDGDETATSALNISYERFFSVHLSNIDRSGIYDAVWTQCGPDLLTGSYPPRSTPVNTKDIVYCPRTSVLYIWNASTVWKLAQPPTDQAAASLGDAEKENMSMDWQWTSCDFRSSRGVKTTKLLSWPPPMTSFAVTAYGGIYELDNEDAEDGGTPRFIGYVGTSMDPPPLTYLTSTRLLDSWDENALTDFFHKSVAQLRSRGYPFCLARLAFLKT